MRAGVWHCRGPPETCRALTLHGAHPRHLARTPCRVEPHRALPEPFDNLFSTAVAASSVVAIVFTLAAPPTPPKQQHHPHSNRPQQLHQDDLEDDTFEWAITAVVSCIPCVNFIAWLMPVISGVTSSSSSASRSQLYMLYAALYAAPLLRSGLDLDTYSLAMLGLGIAHVQAERIACTEPQLLQDLPVLPGLVKGLTAWAQGLTAAGGRSRLGSGAAGPWGDVVRGEQGQADNEAGQEGAADANQELKEFDRMLLEREKKRVGKNKLP